MREAERGFFKEAVEEFGDEKGDGEADEGAEPSAPEGFRGKTVDHVDEAKADAPVDEVYGVGTGAEVLNDGVGKPRPHASEGGSEEDGGESGEADEEGFAATVEPDEGTGEEGEGHPTAGAGTEIGESSKGAEGEEVPVVNEKTFGFKDSRDGNGESSQSNGSEGDGSEKNGSRDAGGAKAGEEEESAEGVEEVELEFQAEGPSRADDVAESEEILEVEKMGGQLGGGGLREVVGGKK